MGQRRYGLWIGGGWLKATQAREVRSPFDGRAVAEAEQASPEQLETAIAASQRAFQVLRFSSRGARSRLLMAMAQGIADRRAELVKRMIEEAGKPRFFADGEVSRAILTFTTAAEEAKRLSGEVVPIDIEPGGKPFGTAVSYWVPRGPVLAISPFNFPLNLAAHKVAPALAAGCSVLLKPPPQAPGACVLLAEIFAEAVVKADARDEIPLAALQVLQAPNEVLAAAVRDPRLATLSFTGSDRVGWALQGQAIKKRVLLELGGNAALIVHSDADLVRAASRAAFGALSYAGQVCISVQRILVQESVYERFKTLLLGEFAKVKCGDPDAVETWVGPVIDDAAAARILGWVDEAKADGARVLCGGKRWAGGGQGRVLEPTLIENAGAGAKVNTEEVFGPVAVLSSYRDFSSAIEQVNASRFGLQAGLFTDSDRIIEQATRAIEVGGLVVNESPAFRSDPMPYGGVKESGLGREGLKYAIEEYSERRVVLRHH